jgi:hypothetical protein
MDQNELKALWQTANEKLERSLQLSRKNEQEIIHLKVNNFLSGMKPIKIFTILTGLVWVGIGSVVVSYLFWYAYSEVSKFFLFSAAIQLALTAIAIFIYLYQLVTIYQMDLSEPVLKTQEHLATLKSSTLWVARILFLQLPLWTTFYWSEAMLQNGNTFLWIIQGAITLSFCYAAAWLFFNIKMENRNKKWFQLIFRGKEWTPLMNALDLLGVIEEYEEEVVS